MAEFRRIPNLFEILSWDYWRLNHGVELPADARAHRDAYLASPAGRTHVLAVVGTKQRAAGRSAAEVEAMPEEHHEFLRFTADAARELYAAHPAVAYVSVFQNWLKPAGASFDHLNKQLVAIDERGAQNEAALARLAAEPNVFNDVAVNAALDAGLVIAANDHAVMFAGFGHRYPTVEVWSRSAVSDPWALPEAELRGMSDLLHAAHAATGADVPCNEEWHTRPAGHAPVRGLTGRPAPPAPRAPLASVNEPPLSVPSRRRRRRKVAARPRGVVRVGDSSWSPGSDAPEPFWYEKCEYDDGHGSPAHPGVRPLRGAGLRGRAPRVHAHGLILS